MKRLKKLAAALLAAAMALSLAACGGGDDSAKLLENMTDFQLPNGTATIKLNKDWITQDVGMDTMLLAGTKLGDQALFLFQFPKDGSMGATDFDGVEALVKQSYNTSDEKELTDFEISNARNGFGYTCTIQPDENKAEGAIVYFETDYAFYSIGFMAGKWSDSHLASLKASLTTFSESEGLGAQLEDSEIENSDTVRWFNASTAILTKLNGQNYNMYGGMPLSDSTRQLEINSLDEWWGVTDRVTADETLDWILTEGHRAQFADDMSYLEGNGIASASDKKAFVLEYFDVEESTAESLAKCYDYYAQYGASAIDGWDYCRALNLMSFYYIAGYYTAEEALDKSLEIGKTVQEKFGSWDELVDSYLRGYEYWAEESSDARREVYTGLLDASDNPYAVDFKLNLEKTW